jgi:predicted dithiol-disulfide oxidoreductase (DUF899 family)
MRRLAVNANHRVVSRKQWLAAREQLLVKEKALTGIRDVVARERRQLPWVRIAKAYEFEGPDGKQSLADLFSGTSQLIIYHFMFAPGWKEGCPSCSFLADHVDGALPHLAARDVSFVAVSRAPFAQIRPFQSRMGWRFKWVSSHGSDFNYDFHVSSTTKEVHGTSVFYRDEQDKIFHTYSSYARGLDLMLGAYNWLDIVSKGRDEDELARTMAWVRHHDRYGQAA